MSVETQSWKELVGAEILRQGAEAIVYTGTFLGRPCIIKERFSKTYRHPKLDAAINTKRIREEAKYLLRCRHAGVDVPTLYYLEPHQRLLFMERIFGNTIRDILNNNPPKEVIDELTDKIGRLLATLHDEGIIHGDLTTSNLILRNDNRSVVLIDFGLTFMSNLLEDKAVDLYVLERAFLSTHPDMESVFAAILEAYRRYSSQGNEALKRLDAVRQRGRKKLAFG